MDSDLSLDEKLADCKYISGGLAPQINRKKNNRKRLMVVFSPATSGWLIDQNESTIYFYAPGMNFNLQWTNEFSKIVLVHEPYFFSIITMLDLLHRMSRNKKFFRNKLFLLIPHGRMSIGECGEYEISEDEFIPIDANELNRLPALPQSSTDPNSMTLTPYHPDFWPRFENLRSWFAVLLKNGFTDLMRNQLYPQLKNGLLESQQLLIRDDENIGGEFDIQRSRKVCTSLKGLFRHCISPADTWHSYVKKFHRADDNLIGEYSFDNVNAQWWSSPSPINELGRVLMPPVDSQRPSIIPASIWKKKRWRFIMNERQPLFPLLLWEGHHAKAFSLECFIPSYNFHELIKAMKDVLAGLPPSELFPDIDGEKWVDVSEFKDGLGSITLDALCRNYQFELDDRTFRVELASLDDIDKLLWNIEKPCGSIYRMKEDKKTTIRIQPDSEEANEYVAGVLAKAVKPVVMQVRQILWDGNRYRQFATSELVRYYANSIAESFDGNCECATRYLDTLNWKYADRFPRHTRIIRHR